MHSSTLLALIFAFGPLAVLSSPRHPPEVIEYFEIIPFDPPARHATTSSANPGGPIVKPGPTKITSISNATITNGTEKNKEVVPNECESEDSTTTATGLATAFTGGAGNSSQPTTLSSVVVADKFRREASSDPLPATTNDLHLRQLDDAASSTTMTSAAAVSGIIPPAGVVAGTGYPSPTTTHGGTVKKVKVNGQDCGKVPVKKIEEGEMGNATLTMTTGSVLR